MRLPIPSVAGDPLHHQLIFDVFVDDTNEGALLEFFDDFVNFMRCELLLEECIDRPGQAYERTWPGGTTFVQILLDKQGTFAERDRF